MVRVECEWMVVEEWRGRRRSLALPFSKTSRVWDDCTMRRRAQVVLAGIRESSRS